MNTVSNIYATIMDKINALPANRQADDSKEVCWKASVALKHRHKVCWHTSVALEDSHKV